MGLPRSTFYDVPATPVGDAEPSERALKERCSERATCDGQVRLLNRQLSLPVSMISQ